jgi:hypothetical protein
MQQDPRGARTHLRDARRLEASRQLGDEADRPRLHGDDADLGRRRTAAARTLAGRRRVLAFLPARRHDERQRERRKRRPA